MQTFFLLTLRFFSYLQSIKFRKIKVHILMLRPFDAGRNGVVDMATSYRLDRAGIESV